MTPSVEINAIHQIELTSRCNLACVYCPQGNFGAFQRPKKDMTMETFERALDWVRFYMDRGTQGEVNLAGTGESTIHPQFVEMVAKTREAVGQHRKITIATNGIAVDKKLVDAIAPYKPEIWVSLHQPAQAANSLELLSKAGILAGVSIDGALNPNDWAGQVEWKKPEGFVIPCPWFKHGWSFVSSEGRLLACCIDCTGESEIGNILAKPGDTMDFVIKPFRLCRKCYQLIDFPGYDQKTGV